MTTRSTEPEFKDLDQILFELIKRGLSLQKALDLLRAIRTVMGPFNVQLPAQSERVPYQHFIDEDEPPRALGELSDFEITVVLGLPPPRARAFQPPFQLVPPPQIRRRAAAPVVAAAPPPHNGNIDLSMNATNAITLEPLEFPQEMVNFHGERALGRYYTQNTFDRFVPNATGRKQNPFTRRPILNGNVRRYRATPEQVPAAAAQEGGTNDPRSNISQNNRSQYNNGQVYDYEEMKVLANITTNANYKLSGDLKSAFILSIEKGNLKMVKDLINIMIWRNKQGIIENSLEYMTENTTLQVVSFLIQKGADVNNYSNHKQDTPLIRAIYFRNLDLIKLLIEKGADVNMDNYNGETPLITACKINKYIPGVKSKYEFVYNTVKLLLEKGADPNHFTEEHEFTALHIAASQGDRGIVEELVNKGANINALDIYGKTPLIRAVINNMLENVIMLITKKANLDIQDKFGNTALIYATVLKRGYIINELNKAGANKYLKNKDGYDIFSITESDPRLKIYPYVSLSGGKKKKTIKRKKNKRKMTRKH